MSGGAGHGRRSAGHLTEARRRVLLDECHHQADDMATGDGTATCSSALTPSTGSSPTVPARWCSSYPAIGTRSPVWGSSVVASPSQPGWWHRRNQRLRSLVSRPRRSLALGPQRLSRSCRAHGAANSLKRGAPQEARVKARVASCAAPHQASTLTMLRRHRAAVRARTGGGGSQ